MTITEALNNLMREAKVNNIDLSDMDDEDIIIYAINFLSANLVDVFEDRLPDEDDIL